MTTDAKTKLLSRQLVSLDQFIASREREFPEASGEFSALLRDISIAARIVNQEVNKAGLADILGSTGHTNIQGEEVKQLDDIANELFLHYLKAGGLTCAIGSEEIDAFIPLNSDHGKYVVLLDPLDGSSNIDVNVSIGTIFSIYKRTTATGEGTLEDVLQPGSHQLCAGDVLYGASTQLVYTTRSAGNILSPDPGTGALLLSHRDVKLPERCEYFSMNERDYSRFTPQMQHYVESVRDKNTDKATCFTPRYIGSMVADVHRNLLKGGIFIYPGTTDKPNGKLRLLFEANPMAFIMEQAGGSATNGTERILDIQPEEIHQRVPVFMGNTDEVERAKGFLG